MSSDTKPINIKDFETAVKGLSDENLISVKAQLINSVSKLKQTNEELSQEIEITKGKVRNLKEEESHDDLRDDLILYTESIEENEIVIKSQNERLAALDNELRQRGLVPETSEEETKQDIKEKSNNEATDEAKDDNSVYL